MSEFRLSTEPQHRSSDLPAIVFLALIALAQGFYAAFLNHAYYATQAPFYDSMSYDNDLAQVLTATHERGVLAGLISASHCATVALPYLLGALAAPFVSASRDVGIWLQVPWVFALLVSCYAMFRVRSAATPAMAAFLALPFTFISAIYNFQGGLSDFRMDLGLYLLLGCSFCWLTVALETRKLLHWAICGLFIGLAALARAIAPVYVAIIFGPILLLRFIFWPAGRKNLIAGISLAAVEAALISGWFYALRYEDLYHYYVVWNPDANAHLPIRESINHFKFAADSVGRWILAGCVIAVGVTIPWDKLQLSRLRRHAADWPWETIFAALAPAAFLALRGAGPNPYVSMPSSFGLVALILALRGKWGSVENWRGTIAACVLATACGLSAYLGYSRHTSVKNNPVAGYRKVLEVVENDSRQHKLPAARFTSIAVGNLCSDTLLNVLTFNLGYSRVEGFTAADKALKMDSSKSPLFTSITYSDWTALPGADDAQRMDRLMKVADSSMDYVFIPSDPTLTWLETKRAYNFMNLYSRWLKQEILADPAWKPISQEIVISPVESYTVYANRGRAKP